MLHHISNHQTRLHALNEINIISFIDGAHFQNKESFPHQQGEDNLKHDLLHCNCAGSSMLNSMLKLQL